MTEFATVHPFFTFLIIMAVWELSKLAIVTFGKRKP